MLTRPDLESLAAQLLPGHMPYVVASSERPTGGESITRNCLGLAGQNVDAVFADWLRSQGRWEGRRPAIFVDDLALEEEYRQRKLGLLIHELGHVEDALPADSAEPTTSSATLAVLQAGLADINISAFRLPAWIGHDAAWIRRCCHLRYRAGLAGHHCELWTIFDGAHYDLPPCENFYYRLDGVRELEDLASVPIGELDLYTPPYLFRALWHDWLDWWEQQNPDLTPHAREILERGRNLYPRRLDRERDWQ